MLTLIELLGTLAFAYSGLVVARRKEMDFVGSYSAAFLSAFGGGTLRDLLLGRHPLTWIANPQWPLLVFAVCLGGLALYRVLPIRIGGPGLQIVDAIGLGLFSATGVSLALQGGVQAFPAVLMGVVTATAGGVLRDLICAEVPQVFRRRSQLYVTCSFAGAAGYALLATVGVGADAALIACVSLTVLLRLTAIHFDLHLPF